MPKFKILAPVLHAGAIRREGEVELDQEVGDRLVLSEVLEAVNTPNTGGQANSGGTDSQLDPETLEMLEDLDVEELKEFAAAKEIDLGKATSLEGILDKIKAALTVNDR